MPGIDPGEFGRAAAAREDERHDHERMVLDELLAAGWSATTAAEARRLQSALADAVHRAMQRSPSLPYSETALNLVGEARGAALADWWAQAHGLDDRTLAIVRECAKAAAAMAMVDAVLLAATPPAPDPLPAAPRIAEQAAARAERLIAYAAR